MINTVRINQANLASSRKVALAFLLVLALFAFELFNFDTTRFALRYVLGNVRFLGISWATILAVAFCAIDFAGLAHLFTPQKVNEESSALWYLMGAWLLGATMNALMTWWAISLTLLSHGATGNEVLSREQLLHAVPIFIAALVWLTRILFIGALSVAGDRLGKRKHVRERVGQEARQRPFATPDSHPVPSSVAGKTSDNVSNSDSGRTRISRRPAQPNRPKRQRPSIPAPMRARQVPVALRARGRNR